MTKTGSTEKEYLGPIRIVVVQRGWVHVGYLSREGDEMVIRKAKTIRRWGTTSGLGELSNGPTKDTVLDIGGTIRLHPLMIVQTYDVDDSKWEEHLA